VGQFAVGGQPEASSELSVSLDGLYQMHRERLTRLAMAITLDRSLAEEIVHDAFVGLCRKESAIVNAEGYLQRSVVNLSVKVLRRRRVAAQHPPALAPVTNIPEIDETWQAVARLPVRQRAVITLRFWEDLSETEIAAALAWPAGTVKSTLHRALKRLREDLP
jgi:RNA polymerase sigma factor (sigma-70 family)